MARRGTVSAMSRKDAKPEVRAARIGFPIIGLKDESAAVGGTERFEPDREVSYEYGQLTELKTAIGRVSRLLLNGGSLEQALDVMEEELGNPVAVVRSGRGTWRSAGLREPTWAPRLADAEARVTGESGRAGTACFIGEMPEPRTYLYWIPGSREHRTAIALFERNRAISPLDTLTVERMSAFVSMEMANIEAVREVEGKYLERFLQDWLSGKIVSERDWSLRAEVCGCELRAAKPVYAAVAGLPECESAEARLAELARRLRSESRGAAGDLLAVNYSGELVLIVADADGEGQDSQEAARDTSLGRLLAELRTTLGMPELRLFAGRPADSPDQLPVSLSQARRTKQAAEVCGLAGDALTYDKLGVYSLLYLIPGGEERERFLRRYMAPLQQADRKGGGRLAETLDMFFQCNGNIKLTSEKLYAHYNTVVYRLDKIQSILGVSLDDPEDRLQLQLSLKLGRISPAPF